MSHLVEFPGLGISFTVNEVAFSIGNFQVRWYGVIIAVGFLLAVCYAFRMCGPMNIDPNRLIDAIFVGLLAGIVCARLYYVIFFDGDLYRNNPMEILKIHEGGLAIYGGLIGAVVFGGLVARARKLRVPAVLDIASLGFLIGQCVGRWGNLVNQEAFGTATDLPWGMVSDNTRLIVSGPVHPCFLYESLLCLVGFLLLQYFNRKLRRYDGQTFLLYSVYYGVCRFFIEGLRTDSLIIPGTSLRVSQVLAAVFALTGVVLLIVFRRRTSLTGCGSKRVMEGVGLNHVHEDPESGVDSILGEGSAEAFRLDSDEELEPESPQETEENAPAGEETPSPAEDQREDELDRPMEDPILEEKEEPPHGEAD